MRPLRLLVITDEMEVGGTQRQITMLLKGIDRSRFEPELVYFRNRSKLVDEVLAAGVPVTQIEKRGRIDLAFVQRLTRFIRHGRYDVIHCFSFTGELWGSVAQLLASRGRLIGSIRGVYEWYGPLQWWIKRQVTRRSYSVVANSHAGAKYAQTRIGSASKGKISVIYNGVPELQSITAAKRESLRGELGLASQTFVTLFVGRLVDHKNLPSLVRAAQILERSSHDQTILLVGDGPERSALMADIQATGCKRIRVLGERDNVEHLMQIADVLVLPSFREGLSNVILEAMVAGTPVVASSVGGNIELVQHGKTGLLYPGDDHEALAERLSLLMNDPALRDELSVAARRYAIANFAPSQMVKQMEDIYLQASERMSSIRLSQGRQQ
jgi:glycosyltransferase involved in cell wall biosynthesis